MLQKRAILSALFVAYVSASFGVAGQELAQETFVFFDTETTGFSPQTDRIIEIGAVKWHKGIVVATREWLIHPGRPIPVQATDVHGITDEMVAGSPEFGDIYPEFITFIDGAVLVAHNAPFDIRHMCAEATRHGFAPPENAVLDSLTLAREIYPNAPAHSLQVLKEHLHLEHHNSHRAKEDALLTQSLFARMLKDDPTATLHGWMRVAGQHFDPSPGPFTAP